MKQPYLLLTPGPLSTTPSVKNAMQIDLSTWDSDYTAITVEIQNQLLEIAHVKSTEYAAVLMQGSGSFGVESVLETTIPKKSQNSDACLMVVINGTYGARIAEMAEKMGINHVNLVIDETTPVTLDLVQNFLKDHPEVTHFATVHCETTTGILNDINTIIPWVSAQGIVTIVDAMSSFGGIPINISNLKIDYLISSANKCIQGVPGFSFIIARIALLEQCKGNSLSVSLDLYAQHISFKEHPGKWRFTSPTHVVLAFAQALKELTIEGGVKKRFIRYTKNQHELVKGMEKLGYETLLPLATQSPIITTFKLPNASFDFPTFYQALKMKHFVIYPGKTTKEPSFRIGTIGDVSSIEIASLLTAIQEVSA
ncbi:2-aminoethylphosphonate--pyruvate transaminase [Dellaglioa sp. BT-FLS60]